MEKISVKLLFAAVAAAFLLPSTACDKDGPGRNGKGEVLFSSSIGQDAPSKTVYGGEDNTGAKERIEWAQGDVIRIASDKAAWIYDDTQMWADYRVATVSSGTGAQSVASLTPQSKNDQGRHGGLVWADDAQHYFAGMYPSPLTFANNSAESSRVSFSYSAGMSAFIPAQQYLRRKGATGADALVLLPSDENTGTSMRYGWMFAPKVAASKASSAVSIEFFPVITAFEFEVSAKTAVTLSSVTLTSDSRAVCGDFSVSANLTCGSGWHPTPSSANAAIPTVTATDANKSVTVTFPDGGVVVPDEDSGSTLRFTILALPQYHNELTATFVTSDGTKTLKLKDSNDAWIPFNGCYMHHISGLIIPVGLTAELNDTIIWSGDFAAEAWDGVLWNAQRLFAEDLDRIIWKTTTP